MAKKKKTKQTKKPSRDVLREQALAKRESEEKVETPRWAYLVIGLTLVGLVFLSLALMLFGAFVGE
jgi:hypothetical protein